MRTRPRLTILFFLAVLGGCAPLTFRTEHAPVPLRRFDAVAVYPFVLDFAHEPFETYARTESFLQILRSAAGPIAVIGPEEFRVSDAAAPPRRGSSLHAQAAALGFAPERIVVLRARAGRKERNTFAVVLDDSGRRVGRLHHWCATYPVEMELVTLGGEVLARTRGEAYEERDDVAGAAADEPYPMLHQALSRMLPSLLTGASPVVRLARRPRRGDLEVLDTHRRLLRGREIARNLAALDEVAQDVRELTYYSRLYPHVRAAWLPRLRQAGDGVLVVGIHGAASRSSLQPLDVITAVDEVPVKGAASFARAFSTGAHTLTVQRGDRRLTVPLPPERADGAIAAWTTSSPPRAKSVQAALLHRGGEQPQD